MNKNHQRGAGYRRAAVRVAILLALGGILAGCGGGNGLETAEVTGTVTLDGKPLGQGTVAFTPERGRAASGQIGPDGSFTLSTYGNGDGAVVGRHQVAILAIDQATLERKGASFEDVAERWLIPRHYGNPASSGLTFEVKAGVHNTTELKLTSRAAR